MSESTESFVEVQKLIEVLKVVEDLLEWENKSNNYEKDARILKAVKEKYCDYVFSIEDIVHGFDNKDWSPKMKENISVRLSPNCLSTFEAGLTASSRAKKKEAKIRAIESPDGRFSHVISTSTITIELSELEAKEFPYPDDDYHCYIPWFIWKFFPHHRDQFQVYNKRVSTTELICHCPKEFLSKFEMQRLKDSTLPFIKRAIENKADVDDLDFKDPAVMKQISDIWGGNAIMGNPDDAKHFDPKLDDDIKELTDSLFR